MQKLIIAGTVTKPAELRRNGGGDPVLGFTVVVDNGKDASGNRRDGTFYECSLWGKRGEAVESHITKGKKLTVIGRPTARAYEGKAYLGVNVDDFTFQGGEGQQDRQQDQGSTGGYGDAARQAPAGYGAGGGPNSRNDMDDEIPFSPSVL